MPIDIRELQPSSFRRQTQRSMLRSARAMGAGCAALASIVTLLAACEDDAPPPRPAAEPLTAEQVTAVQQAAHSSLGAGLATGYSIAIWRDGEVIYREAFGSEDEAGTPATPDTLFQIGSDTKKITAIALLQQVQQHAVDLEAPVSAVLPELDLASAPGFFGRVSLHSLLQHRSGLYDYTPWGDAPDDATLAQVALGPFARQEYLVTPPEIGWQYSNPNYSLAGWIAERLAGVPWADLVGAKVFEPLAMHHSYGRRDDALRAGEDLAWGQGDANNRDESFSLLDDLGSDTGWLAPEDQPDNAFTRPAGMVWSTASDQARLLGFLIDGNAKVLSEPLRQSLLGQHPAVLPHDAQVGYDYGLFVGVGLGTGDGNFYAVPAVEHGGNTMTMTSSSVALPEQRLAVSVLANGAEEELNLLTGRILSIAGQGRFPEPTAPPQPPPPAPDLSVYAGAFTEPNLGDVQLRWVDAQLQIEIPRLDELGVPYDRVLVPARLDVFDWSAAGEPMSLAFYAGLDGSPSSYVLGTGIALTRATPIAKP